MKKVVGVIHLLPLPGSPRGGDFNRALEKAATEAKILAEAGFTGVIVENYGDKPYPKERSHPLTVSSMTAIALKVREVFPGELGINILRNCAVDAVSVAEAVRADFVRVNVLVGARLTDQGIVEGRAREVMGVRRRVRILADVDVKHSLPLSPLYDPVEEAKDAVLRGGADGLIITGKRTSAPPDPKLLERLKRNLPGVEFYVGSGITPKNVELFSEADGFIVGSYLRSGEGPLEMREIERERAKEIVEAVMNLSR